MHIGLQVPDFNWPGGPAALGADLAAVARAADDAGFEFISVMDHFFQIPVVGPPENDMLEAYTTLGYLAACTSAARTCSRSSPVPFTGIRGCSGRSSRRCYFIFDPSRDGEKANEIVDQLGGLAEMGFDTAIGAVANVWDVTPLEIIGTQVIPQVAGM